MKIKVFENANKGALFSSDYKQPKYKLFYGVMVLIMLIYLAVTFIPVVWMLFFGFKEPAEIFSKTPTFFPSKINLKKLSDVWSQYRLYKYYLNTFIMAAGCVVVDVVVNGLAGYVVSRLKPKGVGLYSATVFALMLIPATVSMVPNYMLFMKLNLLNTYIPIWFMCGINMFNILLFKSSFDGISKSLIEAALIDGASSIRIFFKIVVPLSIPVIVTVSIFTFNGQFGNFFWPYLLINDPNKMVMGVRLFLLNSVSLDIKMLLVLFSIIPQVIIFMLFQKHIMGGINIGGVKG